jgi:DNA-binding SARP family transcriptional activator
MTTTVRLLGRPEITTDGQRAPVRGQKSWALLALLALSNRPISRQRVATMLFDRADDPLGALRWTLAQLRRSLGGAAELGGDPLELGRTPKVVVDVDVLANGTWVEALALPGLGETLLAGIDIEASGGFDAWLSAERVRTDAMAAGHLSEAALSGLADGRLDEAARAAGRLVELQPLDEAHHELLVQALAMAGDTEGARRHVAAATRLLTEELGVAPSPTLAAAARVPPGSGARSPSEGRASVIAQLDAGEAAVSAGAIEAGLDCLRRAVHLSTRIDDPPLQIRALTSLGSALVHGLRGSDTEGAVTLHHAIAIGQERDEGPATAPAHRELGWVAVQQGRQHQAIAWLDRAAELADSPAEHARILGVRGITLDDTGRHRDALDTLCASGRLAAEHDEIRQLAWTLAMRARTHLQLGEHSEAEPLVAEALRLTRLQNWNAFLPYPLTQLAELQLLDGDRDAAVENLEHALALGCHIGDPCWEALAERGLAWELSMRGKTEAAVAELESARRCCGRHPDTYRWVTAQILAATCEIGVNRNLPSAPRWVDELEAFSGAAGLRDLVVRAHLHRAALGTADALETATLLALDLDNPTLPIPAALVT